MKLLKSVKFLCVFVFAYQFSYADITTIENYVKDRFEQRENSSISSLDVEAGRGCSSYHHRQSHFGFVGWSGNPLTWYTIDTNSYPEMALLSQQSNKGFAEGGVYLSPTGVTIGEAGNYWVSITAILLNPSSDYTAFVPVYLVLNDEFTPDDPEQIGAVVSLPTGVISTAQGSSILKDVVPGTRLSLVATNAGYPTPQPITVVGWGISLFKLP